MALTNSGDLYGWGECLYLGREQLTDLNDKAVIDIVLPIQVMKDIEWISCGVTHAVAGTKNGRIIAWGDARGFSNSKGEKHHQLPTDITDLVTKQLGSDPLQQAACGNKFTALTTRKGLSLLGQVEEFGARDFQSPDPVVGLSVSYEPCIALLTEKKT